MYMWKLSYWFSQLLACKKKRTESWKQEREREIKKERLSEQEPKGKDVFLLYRQTRNTNNYQPLVSKEVAQQRLLQGWRKPEVQTTKVVEERPAWLPEAWGLAENTSQPGTLFSSAQQALGTVPSGLHGRWEMFLVGFGLVWFSLSSGTSREWKKANPESRVSSTRGSGKCGGGTRGRGMREPPALV